MFVNGGLHRSVFLDRGYRLFSDGLVIEKRFADKREAE
ncbi:hypothetical protein l11_19690 [Neisseria weaveri LMG 5135]|nr:hypothetical protein l13_20160 [Neisseria weaveri ATCC 51223]EGV35598.1 hypothetical protein l11_19690 [Neisseria weaveri LMG 5135]